MSKKQEHSTFLSAEMLQKYREGTLSPREMHRVERLLLENPFYADALEGLDKLGKDTSLNVHLADLKERLHQRVGSHQPSVSLHRTWQIAAAVSLLILSGWIGYYFYFTGGEGQAEQMLSMQKEPPPASEPTPPPLREEENREEIAQAQDEAVTSEKPVLPKVQESESPKNSPVSSDKVEAAEEQVASPLLPDTETLPPLAAQQPVIEAEEEVIEQPALAISKVPEENIDQTSRSSQMLKSKDAGAEVYGSGDGPFTLRGRVVSDEDKSALPGVNVTVKNTSMSTVTDASGHFNLSVPEYQNEVIFNYIGFESKEQTVSEADSNITVALTPDVAALNEIVVVGYGAQEKKAVTDITQAKPLVGYSSYKNYLKEHLQYPRAAKANNIEGVVNVSFDILPNGALQNFSIEKTLGYGCDEEAIRIIREGPAWQPALEAGKAIPQNVTVKVRFSLKD